MKLISVIVAAYNIEAYLPKCLDSILAQTYKALEVILVDDGSADSTGEICDAYGAKDPRITVIHQENRGLSGARNAGLKAANGAYIGYVDGDDWIEPDMYEAMIKACEECGAQIAACAYREVGEGAAESCPTGDRVVLTKREALELYINDHPQYHLYNSVWSKLFRRELVADMVFPEGRSSEDIMYTTRALARADTCVFLDTPYYNYLVNRSTSIMNVRLAERRFDDEIPFWREQTAFFREQGMEDLADLAAYRFYRRMLFYYIDFKDRQMKEAAARLAAMLRGEKALIRQIYRNSCVAAGDLARMRLMLASPGGYYLTVKLYDKLVIPLRQRG